jgi:glycosyltransferase involved in cell wall biosynthesis
MRILVNAIPLTGILTGIHRYVRCLYRELQMLSAVSVAYLTRGSCLSTMPSQPDANQWSRRIERVWHMPDSVIVGLRVLDRLAYEYRIRALCRNHRYDIVHETALFPPAVSDLPVIYTLHDLSLLKHRDKHPQDSVWFFDLFFRRRLPYAAHIVTVSEFIRKEVIEELGVPASAVTAVPLAAQPVFYPRSKAQVISTLDRHGWPHEYILFVGTLEPRKNLSLLIQALALTATKVPLLLAGWAGWGNKQWQSDICRLGLERRVLLTGYVDEEALACLYGGASVFVYPSLYEGFGLPLLEAMACGCPVICSNTSSLPEVSGDAAVLFDPEDAAALADAIDGVLNDVHWRQSLVDQGLRRARLFTWHNTALRTLEVFAKVAGQKDDKRKSRQSFQVM